MACGCRKLKPEAERIAPADADTAPRRSTVKAKAAGRPLGRSVREQRRTKGRG